MERLVSTPPEAFLSKNDGFNQVPFEDDQKTENNIFPTDLGDPVEIYSDKDGNEVFRLYSLVNGTKTGYLPDGSSTPELKYLGSVMWYEIETEKAGKVITLLVHLKYTKQAKEAAYANRNDKDTDEILSHMAENGVPYAISAGRGAKEIESDSAFAATKRGRSRA